MTTAFDSLSFAKRLESKGVSREHAEAHSEAVRDLVMSEVSTKADIAELKNMIERQTLLLTVRTGGFVAVGIGALAAIMRL